jgi:hypothetical protein
VRSPIRLLGHTHVTQLQRETSTCRASNFYIQTYSSRRRVDLPGQFDDRTVSQVKALTHTRQNRTTSQHLVISSLDGHTLPAGIYNGPAAIHTTQAHQTLSRGDLPPGKVQAGDS